MTKDGEGFDRKPRERCDFTGRSRELRRESIVVITTGVTTMATTTNAQAAATGRVVITVAVSNADPI
jgi:hypothetical protein